MIGMFQSSRTASGIERLQASSAFSPSSASIIWKSRPSRMRRATFRITLESSTTRHVLIFQPLASSSRSPFGTFPTPARCKRGLRRLGIGRDFKNAIDIEDDHELAVEAMHAAGKLGHPRVEIDRVFLTTLFRQPQHLADLVDQQAVGLS